MQALAILFAWFSSFTGLSKEAFHRLLYLLHTFLLPAGNKLPPSYYKAHAMINKRIVPVEEYDCCVNDCVLFRNFTSVDYSNMTKCPKCGEGMNLTQELHRRDSNTFQFKHVYVECLGIRHLEASSKPHAHKCNT